jgi:hypothetical protein
VHLITTPVINLKGAGLNEKKGAGDDLVLSKKSMWLMRKMNPVSMFSVLTTTDHDIKISDGLHAAAYVMAFGSQYALN